MSIARFQEIVQRLADADTWDQAALTRVASEIEELEVMVAQIKRPELTGLLEVSSNLVALVPRLDPIEAEDCRRMVVRLIQIALRRLHALGNARKKKPAHPQAASKRAKSPGNRPGMALGDVLVQLGFVTVEDLERALAVSKMKGRMIGEVLVEMGKCEREDVARAVFLQKSLQISDGKDASKEGSGDSDDGGGEGVKDLLLGEALMRRGWISPEELLDALRLHKAKEIKIGEALMRLGYANMEQIQQALAWQTEMRAQQAAKQEVPSAYVAPASEARPAPPLPSEPEQSPTPPPQPAPQPIKMPTAAPQERPAPRSISLTDDDSEG